jgi:prepilin-type N-terminal cleavage/methylation domain-containing protein
VQVPSGEKRNNNSFSSAIKKIWRVFMLYSFRKTQKKGFTLVELLVVISIIALLLAVLMPALQKARISAREVVCSSNLHQLGVAFLAYESSNGRLPQHYAENPGGTVRTAYQESLSNGNGVDLRPQWKAVLPDLNFLSCPLLNKVDISIKAVPLGVKRIYCGYAFVAGFYRDRAVNKTWGPESSRWVKTSQIWRYEGKKVNVLACDRIYRTLNLRLYRINHGQRLGLKPYVVDYDASRRLGLDYVSSVYEGPVTDVMNDLRKKANAIYLFKDGSAKKFEGRDTTIIELIDPPDQDNGRNGSMFVPIR